MLQMERLQILIGYLAEHNYATVKQIAKDIYMSETTVRRDLSYLQKQNVVRRSYGGAVLVSNVKQTTPFDFRVTENKAAKTAIAKKAVSLIRAGDTVFMDESSTVCCLADCLDAAMELTVVTNGMRIMSILRRKNVKAYCTGGLYDPVIDSFKGRHAENFFNGFNADIAFFSTTALSSTGIISDTFEDNVYIKQAMLKNAARTVYLCDEAKFDKTCAYTVCNISDVDVAVTDGTWNAPLLPLIKCAL